MATQARTFTWADIARVNATGAEGPAAQASDKQVLFVIHDKVYDIGQFAAQHPGGEVILTYAGKDATDVFEALHNSSTEEVMADLYVGDLVEEEPKSEEERKALRFVKELRDLKRKYQSLGYFESNKLYYVFKILSTTALGLASIWIVANYGRSTAAVFFAGLLLALFWQQSGWLAHDVLHHQVFENRNLNRAIGYLVGNVYQGFSVSWWTDKHTTHHALPNIHDHDPDIDTMPLLAWSEHALSLFNDLPDKDASKFFLRFQAFYFFPLLALARLSWAIQHHVCQPDGERLFLHQRAPQARRAQPQDRGPDAGDPLGVVHWPHGILPHPAARHPVLCHLAGWMWPVLGARLCPQPQRHADLHQVRVPGDGLFQAPDRDWAGRQAFDLCQLVHRRPELPDRAPHLPQHSSPQLPPHPGGCAAALQGVRHPVSRDRLCRRDAGGAGAATGRCRHNQQGVTCRKTLYRARSQMNRVTITIGSGEERGHAADRSPRRRRTTTGARDMAEKGPLASSSSVGDEQIAAYRLPSLRISRVGQLDASLLDDELQALLSDELFRVLKLLKPGLRDAFEPEIMAILQFAMYRLSIFPARATYGSQLQNLVYRNEYRSKHSLSYDYPPTKLQSWLHVILHVGGRWAWLRFNRAATALGWGDMEPGQWQHRVWQSIGIIERWWRAAHLANFVVFLYDGKYRNLVDRLLGLRLVYARRETSRQISFEFMNRQLVWTAFTEFLLFVLPLVNMASIRASIGRLFSRGSTQKDLPPEMCAICYENLGSPDLSQLSPATVAVRTPYETNCGHVFCYYCVKSNLLGNNGSFPCPRCGKAVVEASKAVPRPLLLEDRVEDRGEEGGEDLADDADDVEGASAEKQ